MFNDQWRLAFLDGEFIVEIKLSNSDRLVLISLLTAVLFLALGYKRSQYTRNDGKNKRREYVCHSVSTPGITNANNRDLARTLFAIGLVRSEKLGGKVADLRGQVVSLKKKIDTKGTFDFRDGNLGSEPGSVRGGGWHEVADVRKRWAILFPEDGSRGQDPNAIFAEIRKAERAARRAAERSGQVLEESKEADNEDGAKGGEN